MPDSHRLEVETTAEAGDRESRAEALLVAGLDDYFNGQYEQAIHIWTRVLFLDRSHARARAYIDRARTALAERQRRADELLHASGQLLGEGRAAEARALLSRATASVPDDERAAALWLQLERLERAHGTSPAVRRDTAAVVDVLPLRPAWPRRTRTPKVLAALALVGVCVVGLATNQIVRSWLGVEASEPYVPLARRAPLPVLSSSEAALLRARTLYARGRLAEALQALDRIAPDSTERAAADALRVQAQQLLLAARRGAVAADAPGKAGRP
jgi:tetratricopeptide (TPR) repeat protein